MTGEKTGRTTGSLERVNGFLECRDLADRMVTFDDRSTRTSQLAADAVGCELGQIVKSLLFVTGDGRPVLALVAGDRRGDAGAIAREIGAAKVRFGDADAVRAATGYAIGGVSPFDLPEELVVLVDDSLRRFDEVWTAGGTPASMVRLSLDEVVELSGGRVATVSKESVE